MACLARIIHHPPFAVAMAASPAHAEKALLEPNLAGTAASWAGFGFGTWFGAASAATIATLGVRDVDLIFDTEGRLFKRDFHVVLEVVAASAAATLPPAAENVTENVAENVTERGTGAETAAVKSTPSAHSGMAKLIVLRAFLWVRKDFVRFSSLLEPFLCRQVSGILVRVVLEGQLAECLFYLGFRCVPMDTKCFVVIAFVTVCQIESFWAKG
jgi:hypothetical protein